MNTTATPNAPPRSKFEDWEAELWVPSEEELYDLENSESVEDTDNNNDKNPLPCPEGYNKLSGLFYGTIDSCYDI